MPQGAALSSPWGKDFRVRVRTRSRFKGAFGRRVGQRRKPAGSPNGRRIVTDSSEVNLEPLVERVVACLRKERISYALIGAWALAVWGQPRATGDVDFLVLIDELNLARLGERLTQAGLTLDESFSLWNPLLRGLQLRFQFAGLTVDLLRPRDAHDQQVFRRRRRQRLAGRYYWVVSPEDFILQKLKVGRPRDFEDALLVVEHSGERLDRRYLQRWADRIGVSAELRYILSL